MNDADARSRLELLRAEARASHAWLRSIVEDVTPEQAMWRPPGRANTIAGTYAHIVRNQDEDMNHGFLGRPMLSEGAWQGKTGLPSGWTDSDGSEWDAGAAIDWPALKTYGDAVGAWVADVLGELTEDDLDRVAKLTTPDRRRWTGLDVVRLTAGNHVWMHGGEIACLKGLQGEKGYRAGLDTFRA
jgi:hypothetical protein